MSSPFGDFSHPTIDGTQFSQGNTSNIFETPSSRQGTTLWTDEEDISLCNIYCHFTQDSATGNDQTGAAFWKKVEKAFVESHPGCQRTLSAIQGRFGKISRQTQYYESQVYKLKIANPSGMGGEHNLKRLANEEFKKFFPRENGTKRAHYYQFMHCYDLLTSQPKWNSELAKSLRDVQSASKAKKKSSKSGYSSSPSGSGGNISQCVGENLLDEFNATNDEDFRPEGCKAAKRRGKTTVELESKVNARHEEHSRRAEKRLVEARDRTEVLKRIADLEEKKLQILSEDLAYKKEHDAYKKQQDAYKKEQEENAIMDKDLDGMSDLEKEFWMGMKRRIITSRFPQLM